MKGFVEFGLETSLHEILFPCRIQNFIKNGTLRGLFSFYWPIFYKALTVKTENTCKKRCLKVVPIKCQR